MINDLLPTDHQARHIAVALQVLRLAGIDAALEAQPHAEHPLAIVLKCSTVQGAVDLRHSVQLTLAHEWQAAAAALAVLQARGAQPC
jgi:hypothetical protein